MKREPSGPPESDLPPELAQPARRALAAGVQHLAQLATMREAEVRHLHGIGPNALAQLRRALAAHGLAFADAPQGNDQ